MPNPTTKQNINTITKEELARKIKDAQHLQLVNVLDPKYYHSGFIKGSLKIPLDQLERRIGELDHHKEVVTYCASYECPASRQAAEKLSALGFSVRAYEGGIKEWKEAGLPTDGATA